MNEHDEPSGPSSIKQTNTPHESVTPLSDRALVAQMPEAPLHWWRRVRKLLVLPPAIAMGVVSLLAGALARAGHGGGGLKTFGLLTLFALPTVIATASALLAEPEVRGKALAWGSATSAALNSVLLSLIGAPLYGEGMICLLMFIPINMVLSAAASAGAHALLKHRLNKLEARHKKRLALLLALLLPLAAPVLDARIHGPDRPLVSVTSVLVVPHSRDAVWATLRQLDVTFTPPPLLSWRRMLPVPVRLVGEGTREGAVRNVIFDNGAIAATVTAVTPPESYILSLAVQPNGREFFNHWIQLADSRFDLIAVDDAHSRIIHTTRYRPQLFPRFLFEPIERFWGEPIQHELMRIYAEQVLFSDDAPPAPLAQLVGREP